MEDAGSGKRPEVYILLLNYKQWHITWECLWSVLQSDYPHYAVFVVDNDSGNRSLEQLAARLEQESARAGKLVPYVLQERVAFRQQYSGRPQARVTFIQNNENKGFAAGNNVVLDVLKEQEAFVWLLNPDMTIVPETLGSLAAFAQQQSSDAVIGAPVRYEAAPEMLFCYGGARLNHFSGRPRMILDANDAGKMDFIYGGCLFTHTRNFRKLGLLPEEYFLYWEETDWCYAAKLHGHPLLVCPDALCYDKISTSIGKGYVSDYYYARNGLYFIAKFHRGRLPVVLFFMGIRWQKRCWTGHWSRARGMLRGTLDFIKGKKYKGH